MKKGIKKLLLGFSLLTFITMLPLTSCSLFKEDGYIITDVTTRVDEVTGDIVVMIQTTSEENPLITFTIPRGDAGEDGVSIENITSDLTSDGKAVILTITYVDNALPPTKITVPVIDGKDGRGVKDINLDYDEEGNVIVTIIYTDDTSEPPFIIPKGSDGNGVDYTDVNYNDPEYVIVTIYYTEPGKEPTIINIPKGVGITSVTYDETRSNDDLYVLMVTYSNGRVSYIEIPRPKSSVWYTGIGSPSNEIGKNGDFYLDQSTGYVYQKNSDGKWVFVLGMLGMGVKEKYDVKFIPKDGTWSDGTTDTLIYKVYYGDFLDLDEIPIPVRDNYEFKGWYTSSEYNPNAGQFTDLTPVLKDITLYPRWI